MTSIQAKIAVVDDLQARRISNTENILREDLSVIESIEATIGIIDVEMGKMPEYLTVGKTPLERVHKLLSKLDSIGGAWNGALFFPRFQVCVEKNFLA